jgi:hypothetical protein
MHTLVNNRDTFSTGRLLIRHFRVMRRAFGLFPLLYSDMITFSSIVSYYPNLTSFISLLLATSLLFGPLGFQDCMHVCNKPMNFSA